MKTKSVAQKEIIRSIVRRHNGFKMLESSYPSYAKRISNRPIDSMTDRQTAILYNRFVKIIAQKNPS